MSEFKAGDRVTFAAGGELVHGEIESRRDDRWTCRRGSERWDVPERLLERERPVLAVGDRVRHTDGTTGTVTALDDDHTGQETPRVQIRTESGGVAWCWITDLKLLAGQTITGTITIGVPVATPPPLRALANLAEAIALPVRIEAVRAMWRKVNPHGTVTWDARAKDGPRWASLALTLGKHVAHIGIGADVSEGKLYDEVNRARGIVGVLALSDWSPPSTKPARTEHHLAFVAGTTRDRGKL